MFKCSDSDYRLRNNSTSHRILKMTKFINTEFKISLFDYEQQLKARDEQRKT